MRVFRIVLGAAGLVAVGFGLWSMREFDVAQLRSAFVWLAGGVVAHDFVLAPIVVALGVVAARVAPARVRTPLVVAFVLWGSLTLVALPALSGPGVRADNPTLLDRPYVAAWLALSAIAVACVLAYALVRRDRRGGRS
ncbi:hypothetical protein [Solicola gregarius]|uniref:Uncharacterized protein n=1 Tax=Solicola gregarius TaxID=2908642 RepID=A0AA46YJP3_9ACTN|nr:hypothetical protein [Solicola gregarius]UYM04557.1 hypothetical protein L0C25_18770 [Solicola gregarius]